jgi:hypothetical protein
VDPGSGMLIDAPCSCDHDLGVCRRDSSGRIVTLNYTGDSSRQVKGRCYQYSAFNAFQSLLSYRLDPLWNPWNGQAGVDLMPWETYHQNRAVALSMKALFDCSPVAAYQTFSMTPGHVEWCAEHYTGVTPPPERCGYCDAYTDMTVVSGNPEVNFDQCSPLQRLYTKPLAYRASAWGTLPTGTDPLALGLLLGWEKKPLYAPVKWFPVNWTNVTDTDGPDLELAPDIKIFAVECDETAAGPNPQTDHDVAIVGYNGTVAGHWYLYVQNSHARNKEIVRIDFDEWVSECAFGAGQIDYPRCGTCLRV